MNVSGFIRRLMSRNLNEEEFVIKVSNTIEQQLKEWDGHYEVIVLKLKNYHWIIKRKEVHYSMELTEREVQQLQRRSPFALDRKLWDELEKQGLPIFKGVGNYLDYVLG